MPNTFSNKESIAHKESLHNQLKKFIPFPSIVEGGVTNPFPTLFCLEGGQKKKHWPSLFKGANCLFSNFCTHHTKNCAIHMNHSRRNRGSERGLYSSLTSSVFFRTTTLEARVQCSPRRESVTSVMAHPWALITRENAATKPGMADTDTGAGNHLQFC